MGDAAKDGMAGGLHARSLSAPSLSPPRADSAARRQQPQLRPAASFPSIKAAVHPQPTGDRSTEPVKAQQQAVGSAAAEMDRPLPNASAADPFQKNPAAVGPLLLQTLLSGGTRMLKVPNKASSRPQERLIRIDTLPLRVSWESKRMDPSSLEFHSIIEIRMGANCRAFDLHAQTIASILSASQTVSAAQDGKRPDFVARAFSIIYVDRSGKYKFLNLVAPSVADCARWVTGLELLRSRLDLEMLGDVPDAQTNMSQWLRTLWREAGGGDDDSSSTSSVESSSDSTKESFLAKRLDLDQVTALMRRLNMGLSKAQIKSMLRQTRGGAAGIRSYGSTHLPASASISSSNASTISAGSGSVTFEAFEKLYRTLRFRPDVAELFSQLAQTHPSYLTASEFESFLVHVQRVSWPRSRCLETYTKFRSPETGRMDMDHFCAFLLSARNPVLNKAHQSVYQDMTRPISSYFINASHNTYLLGDQIAGESSAEGYIRALQRGCRCVEMDCWDGPAGVPVVCHGRTLTTKIPLRDTVEAIARYAFVASPYPLILSLEIRCSSAQQDVLAKTLREVFGEALLVAPVRQGEHELPSPADLVGRILIKAKTGSVKASSLLQTDSLLVSAVQQSISASSRSASPMLSRATSPVTTPFISMPASEPFQNLSNISEMATTPLSQPFGTGMQTPMGGDDESEDDAGDVSPNIGSGATSPSLRVKAETVSQSIHNSVLGPSVGFMVGSHMAPIVSSAATSPASHALAVKRMASFWRLRAGTTISPPSMSPQPPTSPVMSSSVGGQGGSTPRTSIVPLPMGLSVSGSASSDISNTIETTTTTLNNVPSHLHASQTNSIHSHGDDEPRRRARDVPITRSLSDIVVYFKTLSLRTDTFIPNIPFDCMYSLTEKRALSILNRHRSFVMMHTRTHVSRVYPSVIRVSSSNMDPTPYWVHGMQMVALNYQTFDRAMQVNQAVFDVNGRSGYVLKPGCWGGSGCKNESMSDRDDVYGQVDASCAVHATTHGPIVLIITVISAQQLPRPGDTTVASDAISPYVEIELCGSEHDSARFRTRSTTSVHFNSVWREEFRFFVRNPEFAVVRFSVVDSDAKISGGIGTAAVMLGSMEQGYRHVPLCNRRGERMRFSTLFVRITKHVVGLLSNDLQIGNVRNRNMFDSILASEMQLQHHPVPPVSVNPAKTTQQEQVDADQKAVSESVTIEISQQTNA